MRCEYPAFEPCPNGAIRRAVHPSPSVGVLNVCTIHADHSMLASGGFIDPYLPPFDGPTP